MKNFQFSVPYIDCYGGPSGNLLRQTVEVVTQGISPHVNGHLQLTQNAFNASKFFGRYEPLTTSLYNPNGSFRNYTRDSSAEVFLGSYSPKEYAFGDLQTLLRDDVVIRLRGQAGSFQANLLDMYRTRQQTIDMCASTFRRLANAMRCIRVRNFRGACASLGISYRKPRAHHSNIPAIWLEYIYGWKPLLQDLHTILNVPLHDPYLIVRATRSVKRSRQGIEGFERDPKFGLVWKVSADCKATGRVKVKTKGAALNAASQYGLTNPAAVAWEALPFSFVLDWVLPIGPYLEQMTALNGLELSECSITYTFNQVSSGTFISHPYTDPFKYFYTAGQANYERTFWTKLRVLDNLSMPFPHLKSPLSLVHVANALSLLATAFGRKH